jgi:hypothetical protein
MNEIQNKSDALSDALENLQTANHLITNIIRTLPYCGSFILLRPVLISIQYKLCSLSEIAALMMDALERE